MDKKSSYEELEQRVKELQKEAAERKQAEEAQMGTIRDRILIVGLVLLFWPLLAVVRPAKAKGAVGAGRKYERIGLHLRLMAVLAAPMLLIGACGLTGEKQKPVIKLHGGQHESIWINNAISEIIIEKGYGYPVEIVEMTSQMMEAAIQKGEIDLNMETWRQSRIDWYDGQIKKGNIVNLGIIYEASPQFWIIPRWVAEQWKIKTVFDMKDHWELFKDPRDLSKGVFYNCISGWRCRGYNVVKLEAYGLTRYYNSVTPLSAPALEAALARAQMNHQPVFGYFWAPNALMGIYDWHILEEPPYTGQCWEKITAASKDKSLRPIDRACAYQTFPIDKIACKGLLEKAPDVVEMLRKMVVGLEPLNKTLAWAKGSDVQDWHEAAIYYLRNYKNRWKTWVTPEAYEKIEKALEGASR